MFGHVRDTLLTASSRILDLSESRHRAEAKHVDTPIIPGDRGGSGFGRLRNRIAKMVRPTNYRTRAGPHVHIRRTMRRRKLSCRYLLVTSAGHAQL